MMKPWEELKDAFLQSRQLTPTLVKHYSFILLNLLLSQVSPDESHGNSQSRPGKEAAAELNRKYKGRQHQISVKS